MVKKIKIVNIDSNESDEMNKTIQEMLIKEPIEEKVIDESTTPIVTKVKKQKNTRSEKKN
jgi:hypothetical protein